MSLGVDRHVTCHEHDAFGRLISSHSKVILQVPPADCGPDGPMSQDEFFEWNANGQMIGLTTRHDGAETAQFHFEYDDAQRLIAREETISGLRLDYFLEPNGELQALWRRDLSVPNPALRPWWVYELTRDTAGQVTEVLNADWTPATTNGERTFTNYRYDRASRLIQATRQPMVGATTYDRAYTYAPADPWNIASIDDLLTPGAPTTFEHDSDDQIVTPAGWAYDARGNITADPVRSAMTWTLDGRLLSTTKGATTAQYRYDPMNRLVASWTTAPAPAPITLPTVHLWNGWSQVGEYAVGAATRASSVVGGPSGWLGHRTGTASFAVDSHDHQGSRKDGVLDTPLHEPFGDVVGGTL